MPRHTPAVRRALDAAGVLLTMALLGVLLAVAFIGGQDHRDGWCRDHAGRPDACTVGTYRTR